MNVVLVLIDSLRKDHVGVYGNDWIKTPALDALAKESLRFTRAYPESIPSIPARRGIHTGLRSFPFRGWELSNVTEEDVALWGWEPIPEEQTTLAEILGERGYYNLFVTDTLHQFRASYNFHRGFHVYEWIRGQERDLFRPQTPASKKKIEGALLEGPNAAHAEEIMLQYYANTMGRQREEDWFTPRVFGKGMELLEAAKAGADETGQPFFLVVDNYDPHEPWDPPEEYTSLYSDGYEGPEPMTSSSGPSDWLTEAQRDRMQALYSGEVTLMDRWLGRFLEKMGELGLFEDTLLVLLSDHGHAFGEHGYAGKVPAALYPELTDIVFMMRHPGGKRAGEMSDFFALTHDVAPTILGALGIEPTSPVQGADLSVLFDGGNPAPRGHLTAGYHDNVFARDERYAMFAKTSGSEPHLFDLANDPKMNRNIAGDNPDVVKRMWNDYVMKDAGGPLPS
ncbi:MAG: sulfatase-like hydrolase/transferase [Actinomycetota bacterium]|nr:sulfatase-like hydrolase/transferase [Actinomycetota bacterium]